MSTDQAATGPDPDDSTTDAPEEQHDAALESGLEPEFEPDIEDGVLYEEQVQPEYGILGFTLRELLIVGVWALAFIASFFAVAPVTSSVWSHGLAWILPIGVPTAATFLLVLRRFSPEGIRRVGSLGIDQFASVAFSVAAVAWAGMLWDSVAVTIETGMYLVGWVSIFETVAFLGLVALTVFAPFLPRICEDFRGRLETLAHRNANPVRPVIARPRPVVTASAPATEDDRMDPEDVTTDAEDAAAGGAVAPDAAVDDPDATSVIEIPAADAPRLRADRARTAAGEDEAPAQDAAAVTLADDEVTVVIRDGEDAAEAKPPVEDEPPADAEYRADDPHLTTDEFRDLFAPGPAPEQPDTHDVDDDDRDVAAEPGPFWILAGTERDVHDEQGRPLFRIGPQAWALVIEDRDGAFVVRHEDGRIGYLHDITDITKG